MKLFYVKQLQYFNPFDSLILIYWQTDDSPRTQNEFSVIE